MSDPIRACGSCSACCTVLGVPEIEKGTHEPCTHLCDTGCAIYADRPSSCRRFECEWLRGVLEVDGTIDPGLRPDSCGVIFEYRPDTPLGEAYMAWEVEPGASARGPARDVIEGLSERSLVIITAPDPRGEQGLDGRRLVGPPHLVMQASDVVRERARGH